MALHSTLSFICFFQAHHHSHDNLGRSLVTIRDCINKNKGLGIIVSGGEGVSPHFQVVPRGIKGIYHCLKYILYIINMFKHLKTKTIDLYHYSFLILLILM